MSLSNDGSLLAMAKDGNNSDRRHHRHVELFDDPISERKSDNEGQPSPVLTNCRECDGKLHLPGRSFCANLGRYQILSTRMTGMSFKERRYKPTKVTTFHHPPMKIIWLKCDAPDLFEDEDPNTGEPVFVKSLIQSTSSLRHDVLEKIGRHLRQHGITDVPEFDCLAETLEDLDFDDRPLLVSPDRADLDWKSRRGKPAISGPQCVPN